MFRLRRSGADLSVYVDKGSELRAQLIALNETAPNGDHGPRMLTVYTAGTNRAKRWSPCR